MKISVSVFFNGLDIPGCDRLLRTCVVLVWYDRRAAVVEFSTDFVYSLLELFS